ncbi:MAG: choloylglycine hydrolase [Clostridia bacterium]|nr:choloylglycine hydrolase [Clostridia bacterium]
MCTSILMKSKKALFGRNMDIHFPLKGSVIITPRNYTFKFRCTDEIGNHYAMIGMGLIRGDYPLYFEAANEKGLAMAGLNFPDNAFYDENRNSDKVNITPFEIIPYVLSKAKDLAEARQIVENIHLIGINFAPEMPLSPLHFHVATNEGSFVFETTRDGARIYDNPVNVMTNNPTFDYHLANLGNYLNLTPLEPVNSFENLGVQPQSTGLGSLGLPGDFSSASRFVRAAYLLNNSPDRGDENIGQLFHILSSVRKVRGSVITRDMCEYITDYSAVIDLCEGIYYYTTTENSRMSAVSMKNEDLDGKDLISYNAIREQSVFYQN